MVKSVVAWTLVLIVVILIQLMSLLPNPVAGETFQDGRNELGVAYEFKIVVDAGKEDCFYQYVPQHANLYVAFQALRGGDLKAGFAIRDPRGNLIKPYVWTESVDHEEKSVTEPGYYTFCIDNSPSKFVSKMVSLYVASFKRDDWERFVGDLTGYDVTVSNFTKSLANVDANIGSILKSLDHSRRKGVSDWYTLEANHSYIQTWSICQSIVICITSLIQVYIIRLLFADDSLPFAKLSAKFGFGRGVVTFTRPKA